MECTFVPQISRISIPRKSVGCFRPVAALIVAAALGVAGSLPVSAQTAGEPYELPPQIVTDVAPQPVPAPAAGRSVYTGEELKSQGVSTLIEALEQVPSLAVAPVGSSGAQSTISLRGSTSNQVLVLVDGVRVSDPGTSLSDLSRLAISIEDIESIEIVRGGVGAQYGADAVGGVVLITTKRGSSGREFSLKVSNSSRLPAATVSGSGAGATNVPASALSLLDGQSLSFRVGLPAGLALSASAERSSNSYVYYDSNYIRRARANADLSQGKAALSWKGEAGEGSLSVGADLSARSLGVPGSLDTPTPEARQRDLDASLSAEYATDYFFSESVAFKATGYGRYAALEYREDVDSDADVHNSTRAGGEARWSLLAGKASAVNAGISTRYERLDSTVVKNNEGAAPERLSLGAFAEPSIVLGSWSLAPALRWDWTSDFPSGLSAGMGATKALSDKAAFTLSASTAYRAPSFDDLYWPLSGGAEGNPDLKPETAYCGDAGFRWKDGTRSLSASAYVRYSQDVILWQENDDGIWRPTNFGDALYPGLELEFSSDAQPWIFSCSYSFLYSYVLSGGLSLSDDKRVPDVPVHSLNASAAYKSGAFSGALKLSYKGLRYLTTDNKAYLPAVFLLSANLHWKLNKRVSLFWEGENLLNERYESVQGYPMPGFSLKTGLEYKLDGKK